MLVLDQVIFSYGARPAVERISLDLSPGDVLGVVGANGAGKSTLLRLIAGVMPPHQGRIVLNGRDAFLDHSRYCRQLAYLPERAPLYPEMTPRGFIHYRARIKRERWLRVNRRVSEALTRFDLDSVADTPIVRLSKGFRKRVALADAFLLTPALFVLDDPFACLDGPAREALAHAVAESAMRSTLILSGHELEQMIDLCTRFIVLDQGRLAADISLRGRDRAEILPILRQALAGKEPAQS